ncbi:hypothetical protein BJP34_27700 [Moorena producens PAL-8-15-08-1]|uniref:Uncharacterized protein n=1 Tax=Moorena producens PAL-8-15-08-1 TaxID=1458985 RepID=A0A1D8TYV6_9CYAN|nr:hypothetical protein BJP34_27700 [Moorena producens PAL-8-15-08-1]
MVPLLDLGTSSYYHYQGSAPIDVLDNEKWQVCDYFFSRRLLVDNNNRNQNSPEQFQNDIRKKLKIPNHQVFNNEYG